MLDILVAFLAGLILWFLYDQRRSKYLPPGPIRLPILGNLVQLAVRNKGKESYVVLKELSQQYGSVMAIKFGLEWQVIVDDKDLIREYLSGDTWVDRPQNAWLLERSYGKPLGVLWGSGESWKELRRFSLRVLRDFGFGKQRSQEAIMEDELKELMGSFNTKIGTLENPIPLNLHKCFTVSVLNILWSMMAGTRFSHDDARLQKFVISMSEMMKLISVSGNIFFAFPFLRHIVPALTGYGTTRKPFIAQMHQQFKDILNERRELGYFREEQRDYIDVFLNEIEKAKESKSDAPTDIFTEDQFTTTTMDLFVAGSETTSNTLEFGILYMILNPEVQRSVQAEIDHIVGKDRFPNASDKPLMPYTEATILEIQRMSSVVPITARTPNKDAKLGQYTIPKGTFTVFNLYSLHHKESIWEKPYSFRPDRFLNEDRTKVVNADKILPFGLGKRLCLGEVLAKASIFTYFTTLLQNYTFEKSPGHGELSTVPRSGLTLSPAPFHAILKPRLS